MVPPYEGKASRWQARLAMCPASCSVAKVWGSLIKFCRSRIKRRGGPLSPLNIKWVQEWYFAPLDRLELDEPSPPAADRLEEIEPKEYYTNVGNDGRGLRVPADLDESICRYLSL